MIPGFYGNCRRNLLHDLAADAADRLHGKRREQNGIRPPMSRL
jgi:hypothetical protein